MINMLADRVSRPNTAFVVASSQLERRNWMSRIQDSVQTWDADVFEDTSEIVPQPGWSAICGAAGSGFGLAQPPGSGQRGILSDLGSGL